MNLMSSTPYNSVCDWVALSFVTGVGSRTAAMLIDRFGSATACFEASRTALESFGLKRDTVDAIKSSEPRERALRRLLVKLRLGDADAQEHVASYKDRHRRD